MEFAGPAAILDAPLPVGRLALSAVEAAGESVEAFAERRGRGLAPSSQALRPQAPRLSAPRLSAHTAWVADSFGSIGRLRVDGSSSPGFAPLSGFFACADGWVRTHANYPHHRDALISALGLPGEDRRWVTRAFGRLGAVDAADRIIAAGGIAVPVGSTRAWPEHGAFGRPAGASGRLIATGGESPSLDVAERRVHQVPVERRSLPLAGVRIVSLTRVIAGPTAARWLAALGATVVRIDPPQLPELLDAHLDTDFDQVVGRLDVRRGPGRSALARLLDGADGLLLGYRPDALSDLGLDATALMANHPHLSVATIQAWDPRGEWATRRGFDSIVQAASGIALACGTDDAPGALPVQALDHATGYRAAAGLVRGLAEGRGGVRTYALADAAADLLGFGEQSLPSPSTGRIDLDLDPGPDTATTPSGYGTLEYVPPPVAIDGRRLDYSTPPQQYTALPSWSS